MPDTHQARHAVFGRSDVWSYPTFPQSIQSELFDTDSESDPAQGQQMPGASSSQSPQAPARYTCVQGPNEAAPSWGLCFVCAGNVLQQIRLVEELGGEIEAAALNLF
jgi:hypothetical protein